MRNLLLIITCLVSIVATQAQTPTQTVKGLILDSQSEIPIIGATIEWLNPSETSRSGVSDLEGYFKIEGVPVGRQTFRISYLGYESITLSDIEVNSGKHVFLNIKMEEAFNKLDEIVVTSSIDKDKSINEMAAVSVRTFSLEEVNRYAGGRNDVARLASNFAGVATPDDSRNDIVIRGNSPTGVLWRMEGIPIPNPNHFSTTGSTGGPVSALNPNVLSNSDFLTSAFPSEYGDALSGVFDVGLRTGNRDKHEFTIQMAALSGVEAMAEGPLGKGSYLIAARNSFIALISAPGTSATPRYNDLTFKVYFPISKMGRFSFFGIGGTSSIDFFGEDIDDQDLFSTEDEDLFADSQFGVLGLKHNVIIGSDSYLRTVVAGSNSVNKYVLDRYYHLGSSQETKSRFGDGNNTENRLSVSSFFNKKFNAKTTLRTGVLFERNYYELINRGSEFSEDVDGDGIKDIHVEYEFNNSVSTFQPFAQVQHRINEKIKINVGLHGLYQEINEQFVVEPRASLSYDVTDNQTLTLGYGMHSQAQPLPILLTESLDENGTILKTNKDLAFTRSNHYVLAYDYKFAPQWRAKIEAYYQDLNNVPVDSFASSFSLLNLGADFGFPSGKTNLQNKGTGSNTGVELTIEKFFSKGYHALVTATVYNSKYKGSDGVERNTAFNNQYILNVLAGKEFRIGRNAIIVDTKFTYAGGRFYTPVDLEASRNAGYEIVFTDQAFSERYDDYFRLDLKLGFKYNSKKKKVSHQIFMDFQNVTNRANIFSQEYNRLTQDINRKDQSGFFPDFFYRLQF